MRTRSALYRLALEANEGQAYVRDDVLPVPTLDERVSLYLRAVHGDREFTQEERSNARDVLLNSMAVEIAAMEPKVTGPQPPRSYEPAAHYSQRAQRKEAIILTPIARRRTSILALTVTFGLVLIVGGGTLGYRWTYPHMADEVTAPAEQARVPPPSASPRSLSTGPAPDKAAPEQHVLQIVSRRGDAHVLNVFLRLKQEQPALFGQAALKRIDLGPQSTARPPPAKLEPPQAGLEAAGGAGDPARREGPYTAEEPPKAPYTVQLQLGPFASEEDAVAACRALEAADIQCIGR